METRRHGAEPTGPPLLGRHNPRVARLRRVIQREVPDLTVADGVKLTLDLAEADVPIVELFTVAERLDALRSSVAVRRVVEAGRAFLLDPATAEQLAPTRHTQGVLAVVAARPARLRAEGIVLYLDRVQDPGNVGGVIRCAAALGASGVACSPGCADPFSPRVVRASAGQALLLPVQPGAPLGALAEEASRAGGEVAAAVAAGGTPLRRWRARAPLVLVLGNEGQGLSADAVAACGSQVRVPLGAGVESLNVAVTAGVLLASLAGVAGAPILDPSLKRRAR